MIKYENRVKPDLSKAIKICDYNVEKMLNNGLIVISDTSNKKGLANLNSRNGQIHIIVEPKYSQISEFVDGLSIVRGASLLDDYCVINLQGHIILKDSQIELLGDGYIRTNYGIFDVEGNLKTERYKKVDKFIDGLAIVEDEFGYKGAVDQNFQVVIDLIYTELELVNGIYKGKDPIGQKKAYVLLDKQGNELFSSRCKDLSIVANDKLLVNNKNNSWKMINYQNKLLNKQLIKAYHITDFQNGVSIVKNNECYLINEQMQTISKTFPFLFFKPGGYLLANNYHSFVLLNLSGESLCEFKDYTIHGKQMIFTTTKLIGSSHYDAEDFIEPVTLKCIEVQGVMDNEGNILIEPVYSNLYYINDDVYCFNNDKNYGILYKGQEIINILGLINVLQVKDNMIVYEKIINNKRFFNLIDIKGNKIVSDIEKKIFIVNQNQILFNNHLININDFKIIYELLITYQNDTVIRQFSSWKKLVNYQRKFEELIVPMIKHQELLTSQKIKKLQYNGLEKIQGIIKNSDEIIDGVSK